MRVAGQPERFGEKAGRGLGGEKPTGKQGARSEVGAPSQSEGGTPLWALGVGRARVGPAGEEGLVEMPGFEVQG